MDTKDLKKRLHDLEIRSKAQEVAIRQLLKEHLTHDEQISLLFTLVLDDINLEQLGGVN
jgi:uncharacterized coiled-coil protein SlyX